MRHEFVPLILVYNVDFAQIDFIIIFEYVCLRLTNCSNLTDSCDVLPYKSSRAALSHSLLRHTWLVSVLICWKIR